MRKFLIWFIGLLFFSLVILFIFNYRYPFFTPKVGNWSVGYMQTQKLFPTPKLDENNILSYEEIDALIPETIDYIADPFFIKDKDIFYLFVELKAEKNGDIALFTSADGNKYDYKGIVLDEEFHLSYPQVFNYRDEYYMLPETKGSGHLLLYKATNFPFEWGVEDTLLHNTSIKDPSILLSEELNLIVAVNDNLEQFFFTADSLEGEWKKHPNYKSRWGNESRPGGRFFQVDGDWYLPVQNRRMGYGTGISLHKLIKSYGRLALTLEHKMYLESQKQISWFNRGMHHLDVQSNDDGYYMVYDGDRNTDGEKVFQYKRTIKFNLIDFYKLFL
jgi:hypothetical protein